MCIKNSENISSQKFNKNKFNISILQESVKNQQNFINYLEDSIKKISKNDKLINNIDNILTIINDNYESLGITFFYNFISNKDLYHNIITLFYEDLLVEKIKVLYKNIISIFNFESCNDDTLNINPLSSLCDELIEIGIISKNDINKNNRRISLSNIELLFSKLELLFIQWKSYREIGNNVEEDSLDHLNGDLEFIKKLFLEMEFNPKIPKATIEFFNNKIKEIENFKNEKIKNTSNNELVKLKENEKNNEKINLKDDLANEKKHLLKDRKYFYKDEYLVEGENEYIEFKNYYFPLDKEKEEELKRQYCSFINSKGGCLYLGINDQKIVKGIVTKENLVFYKKKLLNLAKDFCPPLDLDNYFKLFYLPIKNINNDNVIPNLYVFKLMIKQGDPSILYSMTSKNISSSIRLQGQCANLVAEEILNEIIERKKLKGIQNHNINSLEKEQGIPYNTDLKSLKDESVLKNDISEMIIKENKKEIFNENEEIKKSHNKEKDEKENDKEIIGIEKNRKKNKRKKRNKSNKKGINKVNEVEIDNPIHQINEDEKQKDEESICFRVTNIENIDFKEIKELIGQFGCEIKKIEQPNGKIKEVYAYFNKNEDASNFFDICDGMDVGGRSIKIKRVIENNKK